MQFEYKMSKRSANKLYEFIKENFPDYIIINDTPRQDKKKFLLTDEEFYNNYEFLGKSFILTHKDSNYYKAMKLQSEGVDICNRNLFELHEDEMDMEFCDTSFILYDFREIEGFEIGLNATSEDLYDIDFTKYNHQKDLPKDCLAHNRMYSCTYYASFPTHQMYKEVYRKIEKYIKKNSKRIHLELSGPFFVFNAPMES